MTAVEWEKSEEDRLLRMPSIARDTIRHKIEGRAITKETRVQTRADFWEIREEFLSEMSGESERDLKAILPCENRSGVEMVVIEACHNDLSNCRNPLINTSEWKKAIEDWARENNISERLRKNIKSDRVRHHNKLRISISACPNACSRPQIADVGIVGFVRPEFDPSECNSCGSCAAACPDGAIRYDGEPPWFELEKCQGCKECFRACPKQCVSLSQPAVRIMVGGKLGRRPRLAESVGEASNMSEALAILDRIVNDYINNADPGERFADYWARSGKEKLR